jgi:quercetin dioxygenase-like cupin family protein
MTGYSFPNLQTKDGEPDRFTGTVQLGEVVRSNDGRNVRVQRVEFSPKARTHWHMHSAEQLLVVLDGTCLLKCFGTPAAYLSTGQSVSIPANMRHWHGAVDCHMAHLALNLGGDSWWMEAVSDSDYQNAGNEAEQAARNGR